MTDRVDIRRVVLGCLSARRLRILSKKAAIRKADALTIGWPALAASFQRDIDRIEGALNAKRQVVREMEVA